MSFAKQLFAQRLRELRKTCGETQPDLSRLLGVTVPQISDMENGKKTTTMEKLALLCEHYQISADYLLGLTDEKRRLDQEDTPKP